MNGTDQKFYIWLKLKDDLENESKAIIYEPFVDVTAPRIEVEIYDSSLGEVEGENLFTNGDITAKITVKDYIDGDDEKLGSGFYPHNDNVSLTGFINTWIGNNAEEDLSSENVIYISTSENVTGNTSVIVTVKDLLGNEKTITSNTLTFDNTPPTKPKIYPHKTSGTNVWLRWAEKPSDSVSGYAYTEIWEGNTKKSTVSGNDVQGKISGVPKGTEHTYTVRFYDKAGNYIEDTVKRPNSYHDGANSLDGYTKINGLIRTTASSGNKATDFSIEAGPVIIDGKTLSDSSFADRDINNNDPKCTFTGNINASDFSWLSIERKFNAGSFNNVQIESMYAMVYMMSQSYCVALKKWADNKGKGYSVKESTSYYKDSPAMGLNFYELMCYCNIMSEMFGLEPVYYYSSNMTSSNIYKNSSRRDYYSDNSKNGYRLPTEEEWEYLATNEGNNKDWVYAGFSNIVNADTAVYYQHRVERKTTHVNNQQYMKYGIQGLMGMSGNAWEATKRPGDSTMLFKGGSYDTSWVEGSPNALYWNDKSVQNLDFSGSDKWGFRLVRNAQW